MDSKFLLKYTKNSAVDIKILYTTIKVIGSLGCILLDFKYFVKKLNNFFFKFYYIKPLYSNYVFNSFIISNSLISSFFIDLVKLMFGVSYGWFFNFNVVGRGFSFRLKKKNHHIFLKVKIGYSHFVYFCVSSQILVKIAKKRNKLIFFSLNFLILAKLI